MQGSRQERDRHDGYLCRFCLVLLQIHRPTEYSEVRPCCVLRASVSVGSSRSRHPDRILYVSDFPGAAPERMGGGSRRWWEEPLDHRAGPTSEKRVGGKEGGLDQKSLRPQCSSEEVSAGPTGSPEHRLSSRDSQVRQRCLCSGPLPLGE